MAQREHQKESRLVRVQEKGQVTLPAAVRYGGFSLVEAVHAATGRAAEAIDIAHETGTLTPGKAVDVLVVDGDVTADIEALARTRAVVRNGEIVAGYRTVRTTDSHLPLH